MKYFLVTVALIAVIAAAACVVSYHVVGDPAVKAAVAKRDALEWLRADFHLTDAQFARIKHLHTEYARVCEEHCRAIQEASRALNQLKATSHDRSTVAAAEIRAKELRMVCETAIVAHVRQCAEEMSPEAGQRYLALILPKIPDFDHRGPPDIQLSRPHGHR